jgi:excisionase family DNA binding protein
MLKGDDHLVITGAEAGKLAWLVGEGKKHARSDGIDVRQWPELISVVDALSELATRHVANGLRTTSEPNRAELLESVTTTAWVTSAEAAEAKGVTRRAVQRAVKAGRLEARREGRELQIDTETLVKWNPRRPKVSM